jgi:hypothetical protein
MTSTATYCIFLKKIPSSLIKIEILDQAKASECHEAMVNTNIDIFEMSYEESVSYFKCLENLEKIRCINSPGPATIPVDDKNTLSVISSVRQFL